MSDSDNARIEILESQLTAANQSLQRIETALTGDDAMGQPGLVNRVGTLEKTAKSLENARWYVLGAVAVIVVLAGFGAWAVDTFLKFKG